jgi:hypothetical protein
MLPVGGISFAGIGGTRCLDITPRALSQVFEMRRRLVLIRRGGEGAIARHHRRGNITAGSHAERRRRGLHDVIFGVLLDDLGHSSIMTAVSDNASDSV